METEGGRTLSDLAARLRRAFDARKNPENERHLHFVRSFSGIPPGVSAARRGAPSHEVLHFP